MFCAVLGQDIRWAFTGQLILWFLEWGYGDFRRRKYLPLFGSPQICVVNKTESAESFIFLQPAKKSVQLNLVAGEFAGRRGLWRTLNMLYIL